MSFVRNVRTSINRKPPESKQPALLRYFTRQLHLMDDPVDTAFQWVVPEDEEEQFYQLMRQWRIDHPEPPKRPQFPNGRTQHESDPDSD